jgi:hypothetical protein
MTRSECSLDLHVGRCGHMWPLWWARTDGVRARAIDDRRKVLELGNLNAQAAKQHAGSRIMTLTQHLPPELDQRLRQEAKRQGLPLDTYTWQLLDKRLPTKDQCLGCVILLKTWMAEGDPGEPRETRSTSSVSLMRIGSLAGSSSLRS